MEPLPHAKQAASDRPTAWRRLVVVGLFLTALIHPIAQLTARLNWRLDLATHFQEPALAVTVVGLIAALLSRNRVFAALFLGLGLYQAIPLMAVWGPNPVPPSRATGKPLRILMANVHDVNDRYDLLAALIRREAPDVVGLVEVTPQWVDGLNRTGIVQSYPQRRSMPFGSRGLAVWFKTPALEILPIEVLTPLGNPIQAARVKLGDRSCTLWLVHPPNPLFDHDLCNEEILALGRRIGRESGTRVAIGDFNRTDGSPYFHDFVRLSGLRDSRIGFGRQGSWPSWSPYRIAIDHAFVSDDISVVARRLGPDVGSDHRPLLLEIAPARIEASSEARR
jgi:endonuclease/exonuclease/phosphatase (EEP) superfamily protein YafD